MQNPVNHSLRLQRNRIPRDGPIPERHKTLAQGPDFQGNQLAHWAAAGVGAVIELWSLWTELFSYSIIHQLFIIMTFSPSFNKCYWEGQGNSLLAIHLTCLHSFLQKACAAFFLLSFLLIHFNNEWGILFFL